MRKLARGAAVLGLVAPGVFLSAPPALAVVTCAFNPVTATAGIAFGPGDVITVARSGSDIQVNGAACGLGPVVATVTTTDTTTFAGVATGNEALTIDLSGGPFAPGLTVEGSGTSEIEFSGIVLGDGTDSLSIVGSSGPDSIAFSAGGIDLNGDGDVDITFGVGGLGTIESFTMNAAGGDDTGSATDFAQPLVLNGSAGDDVLEDGAGDDVLDGGAGSDTAVLAKAGGQVTVDLVAGTASGHEADELVSIESVVGSSFDDTLLGNGTRNNLRGGGGNDRVSGRLRGDRLVGGGGNDRIQGAGGADKLFGNAGADRLAGGPGKDLCKGGAGADRLRGCERKA